MTPGEPVCGAVVSVQPLAGHGQLCAVHLAAPLPTFLLDVGAGQTTIDGWEVDTAEGLSQWRIAHPGATATLWPVSERYGLCERAEFVSGGAT